MHDTDEYVTTKVIVARTGLRPAFWAKRRDKGDGPPFIRISHSCVRYKWGEVIEWLEKHKETISQQRIIK